MSKLIIFSAPSGTGKSTLVRYLINLDLNLQFSISATSREPRGEEKDGVEYFFITSKEFRDKIANNEFIEYEEVYEVDVNDHFEISKNAVKKQARFFKSIIKLDKNFHIYVHGNRKMIEQGVDDEGKKYYKLYYDAEN